MTDLLIVRAELSFEHVCLMRSKLCCEFEARWKYGIRAQRSGGIRVAIIRPRWRVEFVHETIARACCGTEELTVICDS